MVWFQCEDCGENLKKPKLPNHFRICSASRLSCIDCGEIFGQQSVQSHTQCITEAEKYGPKGQAKVSSGTTAKNNKDAKQKPDVDITVGLSERPPWLCSLCNTKATSRQALLLHAEGKKHRAKARAHHFASQPPKQIEEVAKMNASTENTSNGKSADNKHEEEPKLQNVPKVETVHDASQTLNGNLPSTKKRKIHAFENDSKKTTSDTPDETGAGDVHVETANAKEAEMLSKKSKHDLLKEENMAESISMNTKEDTKKKMKWKKLITSALKSNPDGVMKLKKLRKLVLKSLKESGIQEDETQLCNMLEQKINSSSRFMVDDKYVRLGAKD
ncbi:hypothetical protein ACOSQ2_015352 [Xanthoceras sorbifolium]|uniref:U1-type domain-containing protein n=1 Tax=Xanthoceras sorbifolium TaxID=99658 RepID=A0ABQ8I6M3_9ROSI|nr:hypothetical protein JRO89_XS04G0200800 [Xanthoceras sorbifolium]